MLSVANQIRVLYNEQSRADVTECLLELVTEMTLTSILAPERLCMEMAALVSLLHHSLGSGIGTCHMTWLLCTANLVSNDSHSKAQYSFYCAEKLLYVVRKCNSCLETSVC